MRLINWLFSIGQQLAAQLLHRFGNCEAACFVIGQQAVAQFKDRSAAEAML